MDAESGLVVSKMIGINISGTTDVNRNYDLDSDGIIFFDSGYIYLTWNMMGLIFEDSYAAKLKIGRINASMDELQYRDVLT